MYISFSRRNHHRPTRLKRTVSGKLVPGHDIHPIRSTEKIQQIALFLSKRPRNLFLFLLGINTGLRVSDLLWLQVRDVRTGEHVVVREIKTGKIRRFLINEHLRPIIDRYIAGKPDTAYLFASTRYPHLPIGRVAAYKILRKAGEHVGLDHVGTHSLRKTFGYHYYRTTNDIVTLMMIFNHHHQSLTLQYIGWAQQSVDASLEHFILGT